MFEQAVQASEALRQAAQDQGTLIPAVAGCRTCGTARMIAAPALGSCEGCGAGLTVLGGAEAEGSEAMEPAFAA